MRTNGLYALAAVLSVAMACSKAYDDSALQERLDKVEADVENVASMLDGYKSQLDKYQTFIFDVDCSRTNFLVWNDYRIFYLISKFAKTAAKHYTGKRFSSPQPSRNVFGRLHNLFYSRIHSSYMILLNMFRACESISSSPSTTRLRITKRPLQITDSTQSLCAEYTRLASNEPGERNS